jgi:hypothetical protein
MVMLSSFSQLQTGKMQDHIPMETTVGLIDLPSFFNVKLEDECLFSCTFP